ncbi:MAG: phosphoribosylanthranilate isomerase [Chloroflexi bacterium OHK40]
MLVKICGLRTVEHALAAASADMLGLVFAPSRRQVSVEQAATIAAALRARGAPAPRLVGLFVNASPASIITVASAVGLDLVQLSGDEPPEDADALSLPVIKAVRMDGSARETAWIRRAASGELTLLVDAHVPGAYGGTGVRADWQRAAELAATTPLILAGGLTPANVATAISAVRPLGVDVSSGVETDGHKDPAKIEAFLEAARSAR